MEYTFSPRGVCSRGLSFEIEEDKVKNVCFNGGCNGNLQGIASLVEGMPVEQVIDKLSGIKCGYKNTSCPDQLAQALHQLSEAKE
ncbi:TIGR03905 family TSCPD domain-containing protein [Aminipila luticellarii]|uniref:ribonucleoside-diphosphate reductase n=1 Tax=Aminipila luticellarii TaxID=2507160 RepID=A0A410PYQ1_9FIRM|nr:TIGR03905 family TSCPD domain-containing protein [Aminipila luticellarii]QAT43980.1 TIGR03905 family TSCPD domain-containing protein [Aminipila luticellarii]